MERLLKLGDIERMTGLSKMTIYRLRSSGQFPPGIRVGDRAVRWLESELVEWLKTRPRTAARL